MAHLHYGAFLPNGQFVQSAAPYIAVTYDNNLWAHFTEHSQGRTAKTVATRARKQGLDTVAYTFNGIAGKWERF
jgi:hypothetical protein